MSQTAALLRVTDSARVSRQPVWVWTIAGAMASGLLMAACYWPLDWHWLAWVAWVPWLVVLPRVSPAGAWLGVTPGPRRCVGVGQPRRSRGRTGPCGASQVRVMSVRQV